MAEASLRTSRFFCHRCSEEIRPHLPDYTCPKCDSGFIEEMTSIEDEPVSTPTSASTTTSTSTPVLSLTPISSSSTPIWTSTSVMSSGEQNWHSFSNLAQHLFTLLSPYSQPILLSLSRIGVTSETSNDSNNQRERDTGSR